MNKLRFAGEEEISVRERKKRLRAYMKERRADNENRDVKEALLAENFFKLLGELFGERTGAGTRLTCFCYLSYSSEAPTDKLIERLLEAGVNVTCPRVEGNEMVAVEYGADVALSERGIREPIGEAYEGEINLIVLPLLAVDKRGNRLGYGGGYYDAFVKAHPQAKRVAYGYDFQVIGEVPTEETDERAEYIVTDKRAFKTE